MENIIVTAAGIDKLPGRFLKDGTEILSEPISEICNLWVSYRIFPNACNIAKLQPNSRKTRKSTHLITGLSRYCHCFKKIIE